MSDSIGSVSVRSDAYYLLAELFERAELDELLDAQTGVLLGIALSDLLREGWTILAPPEKVDLSAIMETLRMYAPKVEL